MGRGVGDGGVVGGDAGLLPHLRIHVMIRMMMMMMMTIKMMMKMLLLLLLCGPHSISSAGKNVPVHVHVRDEWVGG